MFKKTALLAEDIFPNNDNDDDDEGGWCGKLSPGYSTERESELQPIGSLHSPLPASHWSSPLSARDR